MPTDSRKIDDLYYLKILLSQGSNSTLLYYLKIFKFIWNDSDCPLVVLHY